MALVIRWTDQAFEDLDDILEFIENKFGPDRSQEVFVKINNVVDLLILASEKKNKQNEFLTSPCTA